MQNASFYNLEFMNDLIQHHFPDLEFFCQGEFFDPVIDKDLRPTWNCCWWAFDLEKSRFKFEIDWDPSDECFYVFVGHASGYASTLINISDPDCFIKIQEIIVGLNNG